MSVSHDLQALINSGGVICPPGKNKVEITDSVEKGLFIEVRAAQKTAPVFRLRMKNGQGTNIYRTLGTMTNLP